MELVRLEEQTRAQRRHGRRSWQLPKQSHNRGSRRVEWSERKRRGLGERGRAGDRQAGAPGHGGHLQVPAWYLRALTLCLWAVNVRTCSPVSASQHLTVLSALPEYTCWFTSCGGGRGGGTVGPGHSRPAQKPLQTSLCNRGGARAGLSRETVDGPEMPLPGGPTRPPTLAPEVMLPTPYPLCRAVGVRRACRHRADLAADPHWPLALCQVTDYSQSFTHSEDQARPLLVGLRPNQAALSTLTVGARKCRLPLPLPPSPPPGVSR